MEWSKIKTIIILILVCVNLFLLSLVGVREGKSARYQEEALAGAVAVLEKNGVAFLPQRTPKDMTLPTRAVTRDRGWEQTAAEGLLGQVERKDEYDGLRVTYGSGLGSGEFSSDGRFRFVLSRDARPLGERSAREDSEACMRALGLTGVYVSTATADGGEDVVWHQTWAGAPLFSCTVTFSYREGALSGVEGRALSGQESVSRGEQPLSTATVLVRFLAGMNEGGFVCSEIVEMTPGYLDSGSKPVKLSPVWLIATDTGAYYLDGLTGELRATEA